ncbi:hypothetical protein FRC07_003955 [Ceratobasidium sp. 392]|nr:hypothetical protein FRC07_003955 [Ceratobasidium sp. 392]
MLFLLPLIAVTTLLRTIVPDAPIPESMIPTTVTTHGTDVSRMILEYCPSPAVVMEELELAPQLSSSTDLLVYSAPLGHHTWRSFPAVRHLTRTVVTRVSGLISALRTTFGPRQGSARHAQARGHGTSGGRRHGELTLAIAMVKMGLLSPSMLTLPAPQPMLALPAPPIMLGLPAPKPLLSLPAPPLVLGLPALKPLLSLPAPRPRLTLPAPPLLLGLPAPKPLLSLPAPRPLLTLPAPKADVTMQPALMATRPALPSPGPTPINATYSVSTSTLPSSPPAPTAFATMRGFYPVATKPVVYSSTRKWQSYIFMACLAVLTLGFHSASNHLFEGIDRHSVGLEYHLDGGKHGLKYALDPFDGMAMDVFDTARSGILSGLAPDLFRLCEQPLDATPTDALRLPLEPTFGPDMEINAPDKQSATGAADKEVGLDTENTTANETVDKGDQMECQEQGPKVDSTTDTTSSSLESRWEVYGRHDPFLWSDEPDLSGINYSTTTTNITSELVDVPCESDTEPTEPSSESEHVRTDSNKETMAEDDNVLEPHEEEPRVDTTAETTNDPTNCSSRNLLDLYRKPDNFDRSHEPDVPAAKNSIDTADITSESVDAQREPELEPSQSGRESECARTESLVARIQVVGSGTLASWWAVPKEPSSGTGLGSGDQNREGNHGGVRNGGRGGLDNRRNGGGGSHRSGGGGGGSRTSGSYGGNYTSGNASASQGGGTSGVASVIGGGGGTNTRMGSKPAARRKGGRAPRQ